ncbi:NDR1/HIN1-like protein 6 [Panicum virgatum]|uniref:NDR1/HIN1-like protein 6 n=1 Tax=Panicum virgatum TaxID=38727 RepID=UPI0019D525BC|nr:NDR1/HIN1-like protein 6 [Panicum virgatum]
MARLETIGEDEVCVDLEAGRHSPPPLPATPPTAAANELSSPCCFLLVAAVAAALLGALYLALDPKLPRYTVDALTVTAFGMDDDLTARARFDASVRFENPNRAIGIRYEDGSSLSVWFRGYRLSEGALPAFYQGPRAGAATVRVDMGEARLRGTGVVEAMRHVNGAGGGELPLVFRGEVPVRVRVGPVTTARVTPRVRCDLVLDRLATEGSVRVKNMDCKFSLKLW